MTQNEQVWEVLKDGGWHDIREIHDRVGPLRLNSRVAELRVQKGVEIDCEKKRIAFDEKRRPVYSYFYRARVDASALDPGASVGEPAAPGSSAGDPSTTPPPALTLDEYGLDQAIVDANEAHPGMLPEIERVPSIEEQRANLAQLQETLFGKAA